MSLAPMEEISDHDEAGRGLTYSYQPRLGGAGTRLTLDGDRLAYAVGPREGQIDLRDVSRVRLVFHPAKFAHSSFEMRLRTWDGRQLKLGSVSRVSLTGVRDQSADYAAFVRAVHERLAHLGMSGAIRGHPPVAFTGGFAHLRWWVTAAVGLLALAVMVGVLGFALIDRQWVAAAFIAALCAFTALPMVEMISRNKPVTYRPDRIPPQLLPG